MEEKVSLPIWGGRGGSASILVSLQAGDMHPLRCFSLALSLRGREGLFFYRVCPSLKYMGRLKSKRKGSAGDVGSSGGAQRAGAGQEDGGGPGTVPDRHCGTHPVRDPVDRDGIPHQQQVWVCWKRYLTMGNNKSINPTTMGQLNMGQSLQLYGSTFLCRTDFR